jgi:hypothetical protein
MTLYVNKSRLERPYLQKKDLVYLLRRNIKIIKLSGKLDLKKIGSFKVKRNIRDISFELKLFLIIRIYPIFYLSLLESAHPDISKGLTPECHDTYLSGGRSLGSGGNARLDSIVKIIA